MCLAAQSLASGGRRLHVGLTEFSEDVSAATHWVGKAFKDKIMRTSKTASTPQQRAEGSSQGEASSWNALHHVAALNTSHLLQRLRLNHGPIANHLILPVEQIV